MSIQENDIEQALLQNEYRDHNQPLDKVFKELKSNGGDYKPVDTHVVKDYALPKVQEAEKLAKKYISDYEPYSQFRDNPKLNKILSSNQLPFIDTLNLARSSNDPKIFATISRCDGNFFKKNQILEFITLTEYKSLARIRFQDYIAILIKLLQVFKTEEDFKIILKEILKEKNFVSLIFESIDISSLENATMENKEEYFDFELLTIKLLAACTVFSVENNYNTVSTNYYGEPIDHELQKEEQRWREKVVFLKQMQDKIDADITLQPLKFWFEAKVESLYQLDIKVKDNIIKNEDVFDLLSFYEAKKRAQKNPPTKQASKDEFSSEFQTQIKSSFLQPLRLNSQSIYDYLNQRYPCYQNQSNIREKEVLRIRERELQTDYLIHVWRWGEFGFEKIFEKRIFTQDRKLEIGKFEFLNEHQYLKVTLSKPINTQLIFNTKAPFKDPIMLDYDQEILGVYYLKNEKENAGIPRYGIDKDCLEQLIIKDTEHSVKVFNILNGTHIKTNYVSWTPQITAGTTQKRKTTKKRIVRQFTNALDSKNMDIVIEDDKGIRDMKFSTIKGIYSIRKEEKVMTEDGKTQVHYSIITNEQYKLPMISINNSDYEITVTQDTQKVLLQYKVDKEYLFKLYEFDQVSKSYKESKDKFDPISLDLEIMKVQGREKIVEQKAYVYPTEDNFIICYDNDNDKVYKSRIFLGNKFVKSVKDKYGDLIFSSQDNIISIQYKYPSIYNNKISDFRYLSIDPKDLITKTAQNKKETFKWVKSKTRYLFNIEFHVNLPYAFFIYNHDQVYMTNIEDIEEQGKFYYMNDFLQIPVTSRPLTVLGYNDRNKMKLSVPCLEKNPTLTNFQINVHAIQSKRKLTGAYNLQKFCKQSIHKFNEKALQEFITQYKPKTLEFIKEGKPNYNEIQVSNDYNAVSIGFYNYNQIILKIKLHISYPNKNDNNATTLRENSYSDRYYFDRRYFYSIYTSKEVNYVIKQDMISGDESRLKPYENEIPEYYISDVLYDSLDGEGFTVYVIHATKDGAKKNIFKQFQFDILQSIQKPLEEQKYNTFSGSIQQNNPFFFAQQKNIFANKTIITASYDSQTILYGKILDTEDKKYQCSNLAYSFMPYYGTQIQKCVSINGARLFLFNSISRYSEEYEELAAQQNEIVEEEVKNEEQEQQEEEQQKDGLEDEEGDGEKGEEESSEQKQEEIQEEQQEEKIGVYEKDDYKDGQRGYIIGQALHLSKKMFLNSYDHFIHKTVPVFNEEQIYSVQFSLTTEFREHGLNFNSQLGYPSQDHRTYNKIRYISPGLIINYRNAQKQIIPLLEYGYEFVEIIKYNQSGNGQFIILGGIMKKPTKSRDLFKQKINDYYQDNLTLEGIFLFHLFKDQIELKSIIPYAQPKIFRKFTEQGCQIILDIPIQPKQSEHLTPTEKKNQLLHVAEEKKEAELLLAHDNEEINKKLQELLKEESQKSEYIRHDLEYFNLAYNNDMIRAREEFVFIKEEPLQIEKFNNNLREELKVKLEKKLAKDYTQKKAKIPNLTVADFLKSIGQEEDPKKTEKEEKKTEQEKAAAQQQAQDSQKKKNQSDFEQEYALFNSIKDFNIQRFEFQRHQKSQLDIPYLFTLFDTQLIQDFKEEFYLNFVNQQQHSQMVLKVCLDGEILLIDRFSNTIYCFIFNEDTFDYEFRKQQFGRDFVIQNADIDKRLLVVASHYDYRVYDLNKTDSTGKQLYQYTGITHQIFSNNDLFKSYEIKQNDKIEKLQDFEQPKLKIDQINIKGQRVLINYTIINFDESELEAFLIYDYSLQTQILQLSGDILVSGDKNNLWDKTNNIVYDIEHMSHTLFFWNEAPFSHPQVFSGNTFYVNKDRTILCTQGYIQFAYDYLNTFNKSITCEYNVKLPLYLQAYKIDDKENSLSFIGEDENWTKKLLEVFKNIELIEQYHIDTYKQPENWQDKQFTYFFLSYVYPEAQAFNALDKSQVIVAKDKDNKSQPGFNILRTLFSQTQIKLELIEEILKVIILTDSPMKTKVVNSVFVQLLSQNSPSFQEYIEKTRLQTSQMQNIDKFFIEDDIDGGQYFFCTNQIIVDRDFYLKYKNYDTQTKKEVEITYIEVGEILVGDQGDQLMTKLSHPDNLDKMSLPFLEKLVLFQWEKVKKTIYIRLFFPFILQLLLFSFYATFQVSYDPDENDDVNLSQISCILSLVTVLTYFMYMEVIQFMEEPTEYFTTVWNIADLITILLCYLVIFLDLIGVGHTVNRKMSSISVIILWIKFFYFLRIFDQTAFLIRMITEIVNDMRNFLIVLVIGVVGFCNGFYILTKGQPQIMGSNAFEALIYTYRMALGDFQLDAIGDLPVNDLILFWFLFIVASLFVVIVLLNLLIAIMGDTFGRVNENITNLSIREKAMLVDENEHLFNRSLLFKDCKYLVIIKDASFQQSSLQNWDGQINAMKRQVIDNIDKFKKEMNEILARNETQITEMKKKMIEGEEKAVKNYEKIFSSFGSIVKEINENFEQKLEIAHVKSSQAQQRELLSLKFQILDKIDKKELNPKMFEQFQIKKEDLISQAKV